MSDFADAEARRRIQEDFGDTLFVEAAAGTGKTTALVGRIVGLLRAGLGLLDHLVAVTFTEKAAGEMKLRLRTEIEKARAGATPQEHRRLDRALEELELARIGTIHSFCGDLLHERPIEAGIDPLFEVASEDEAQKLADEAFDSWFETVLADPPEGVRRILRRRPGRSSPREQLRTAMHTLRDHRDFPTPWRRQPFERDRAIDVVMTELSALGELAAKSSWRDDHLTQNLAEISRFVAEEARLAAVRGRDYDGLEADLRAVARWRSWNRKGAPRTRFGGISRDEVLARRDRAKTSLDVFIEASEADLAPLLHNALQTPIEAYDVLKIKAGRLDFLDLLVKARDLVRDNAAVRHELQVRYGHYFVDEFQDTDPLQAEILLLLAADDPNEASWHTARPIPGKLFLVGDPKQSIYRFRRADVSLYEEVKERLQRLGAEVLHLTTSFRAPPSIQSFVNLAFAPAMALGAGGSQAAYVPLGPSRPEIVGRPTVVALPVPRPYGDYGKVVNFRIEQSFPDAAAAFIAWLVNESGWTVEEGGNPVSVQPHHIAILFRRFRNFDVDMTRAYVRGLEARRVPHVLVGGRSFHDREEIIALRNALTAIEWPDDELSVFATLRGPFFAIGDEALLVFRQHVALDGELKTQRLNPMRTIDRSVLSPGAVEVADALEVLRTLHGSRNYRPIAATISKLLATLRAQAGIALWPNGEQALANCQRLIDMARQFESGASSFRAFVEKLEADAERGEADEAPIVEEGVEGVRIMTVHKAKGLEFPVVILADPTCNAARDKPSRHVDSTRRLWVEAVCGCAPIELLEAANDELRRDQAEAVRVAYVAATRARDLLVSPVCGDEPIDGWLDALKSGLYPPDALRRAPSDADGCPAFGDDSVLDRGPQGVAPVEGSVRPGSHRLVHEGPNVIWWDPSALSLEVEELGALRHQRILEGGPDGTAGTESEQDYAAWKKRKTDLLSQGSQRSLSIRTVTALTGSDVSERFADLSVQIDKVERDDPDRPGGRRFGALVHTVLASVDLNAETEDVRASAVITGKMIGATETEVSAAVVAVRAALAHPLLRRAADSARERAIRRETPVVLKLDDGSLVEGVVDLAFWEEGPEFAGWTVVDFKTDREFAASSERYITQVITYAAAVRAATRRPSQGIILIV
jgi:ATP-dependent helicase/nuclease subunit A